jgi:hypothetical protein
MGQVSTEQTVAIIDSVARAVHPVVQQPEGEPWWQIFAIVGGTIATLLTAWAGYVAVKRKKTKNDK